MTQPPPPLGQGFNFIFGGLLPLGGNVGGLNSLIVFSVVSYYKQILF